MAKTTPKILIIPGSNRAGSHNAKLAGAAVKEMSLQGAATTWISLVDYPLPIMDEDHEREKGIPENVMKIARLFVEHDGVFLVCPEYNSSITPLMKNMLDWVSRVKEVDGRKPYADRAFAIAAASPGKLGGIRMLPHLRQVIVTLGGEIIPQQFALGAAHNAFDDKDELKEEAGAPLFKAMCSKLIERARYFTVT